MVRFDFPIYIGCECKDRGPIIKCHDTGVTLGLHLKTVTKSKWMQVEEDYRIPDGTTAVIRVKKPDNTVVLTDDGITFEGGSTVVCSGLEQAYTAPGTCRAELSLYNPEGKRLTSATFTFEVESECVCDEDERSEDYLNILGGVVQEVNAAAASAAESAAEAEEWAKKAAAGGGAVIDSLPAAKVTFADGENFQQKYDSGKLTGPAGKDGKDGAPGSPGADGKNGVDGKDGEKGDKGDPFTYADFTPEQLAALVGPQGEPGEAGATGNGIASIERTEGNGAPGTTDTYTVTMTNESTATFTVYNGKDGKDGESGSGGGSGGLVPVIDIIVHDGAAVTCTDGVTTLTATSVDNHCVIEIPNFARWTVTAELDGITSTRVITVDAVKLYTVTLWVKKIYGASWNRTSTTAWSRTDAAENLGDPNPSVAGMGGSSPFDNIYPWAEMNVVNDEAGGALVAIPKFWFKWTDDPNELKLQIADYPADGFHVSPAHADRGDGHGERDVIYVGKYYCGSGTCKSLSGQNPNTSTAHATVRTKVKSIGDEFHIMDLQTYYTIVMLYLVEYADWDCSRKIGCGFGKAANGTTDGIQYHTGCASSVRANTSNNWIKYRNIENLWNNAYRFLVDGAYFKATKFYAINDVGSFANADTLTGGTLIGTTPTTSSGFIQNMTVSTAEGFEWFVHPSAVGGSDSTYAADVWAAGSGSYRVGFGTSATNNGNLNSGLFSLYGMSASDSSDILAHRLMKLPNKGDD